MNKLAPYSKYIFWGVITFLVISNIANFNISIQKYLDNKNKIEALTNKATCYREYAKAGETNVNLLIDCSNIYNEVFGK